MDDNQMDEFFRNKLKDHSSPIPENMWQRIWPENDKDRKVFFLWYWYFPVAILLIASLTAGYFIWNTNKDSDKKNNISAVGKSIIPDKGKNKNKNIELRNIKRESKYDSAGHEASLSKTRIDVNATETIANKKGIKITETDQYTASSKASSNVYKVYRKQKKLNSGNNTQTVSVQNDDAMQRENEEYASAAHIHQDNPVDNIVCDSSNNKFPSGILFAQPDSLTNKETDTSNSQSKKKPFQSSLKRKDWFLELYGSPDVAFNNIDPDYKYFHSALSFTSGLRLGKPFGKHLSGRVGIQYSQINLYTLADSGFKKFYTRYNSIDMPLLIGYEIKNKHYNVTFNTGIILNIYSWYAGTFFGVNPNNIYKKTTGLSLYFGVNYARKLSDKFLIFTEPYYKYRLSNIANKNQIFSQKINIAGLTLGVRYNFF